MEINKEDVGKRIYMIRKSLGDTMKEFGNRMGNPPASDSIVSRWEKGKSLPNNERSKKIAELGSMSVNELLYGNPKEYIYNVIINELGNQGKLWTTLKTYLEENKNLSDINEIQSESTKLINENFDKIFNIVYLPMSNYNLNSSKGEHLTVYQLNRETIINAAISYFTPKKEYTFEEYYKTLKNSLNSVPYFATSKSLKELTNQFLESGHSEEEARYKALDKFYMSEATEPIESFSETLDNLYNEYLENK